VVVLGEALRAARRACEGRATSHGRLTWVRLARAVEYMRAVGCGRWGGTRLDLAGLQADSEVGDERVLRLACGAREGEVGGRCAGGRGVVVLGDKMRQGETRRSRLIGLRLCYAMLCYAMLC
jgi:hypothetical protein